MATAKKLKEKDVLRTKCENCQEYESMNDSDTLLRCIKCGSIAVRTPFGFRDVSSEPPRDKSMGGASDNDEKKIDG